MNKILNKKCCTYAIIGLFIIMIFFPITNSNFLNNTVLENKKSGDNIPLPTPLQLDVNLEEALMKRMSVREFKEDPVTDEELATVLWAAYGKTSDGTYTIPKINGQYSTVIYIFREDGVYTYDPDEHALIYYKEGDYRDEVGWQWSAPIQIGLCWNSDIADENLASVELGAVGQNIYFSAISIGLGTVITAQTPNPAIKPIGLPENHKGMGLMPLGHPTKNYDFVKRPFWISLLPKISFSEMNLEETYQAYEQVTTWNSDKISRKDLSQLLWSSYGYSYYIDESQFDVNIIKRHRTVPSAHGYYPLSIYAINKNYIVEYFYGMIGVDKIGLPILSFLSLKKIGDHRQNIAEASEEYLAEAPLLIIPVLEIERANQRDDLSGENLRWIWHYEAGACAHNILLQATTKNLAGNIATINDKDSICATLGLDNEKFDPLIIIAVG